MKKCQYCGAQIPEEAIYCLNCASILNTRQDFKPHNKNNNKLLSIIAISLSILFVFIACLFVVYSANKNTPSSHPDASQLIPETDKMGAIVTNDQGEQVFETVDTTESSTEEKGLFDKLFGNDETENQDDKTESTTKKPSLLDKIFNDDKYEKTTSPEPKTTTASTSTTTSTESITDSTTTTTSSTTAQTTEKNTETTTQESTHIQIDLFEYAEVNEKIKITGFNGNDSKVIVPAYINGKHVAYLGENAFSDKSNIKEIIFMGTTSGTEKFFLPSGKTVFNNLPNLESVTFPYETHYRMVKDNEQNTNFTFYKLFVDCPSIKGIYFNSKTNNDYSSSILTMYSVNGVVFSKFDSSTVDSHLIYYPVAKTNSEYTIPDRVVQIDTNAFMNNYHIKKIHFGKNTKYVTANFLGCSNLEEFTVSEDNAKLFSENGVLYTGGMTVNNVYYNAAYYPAGKKDIHFEFTNKCNLLIDGNTFCGNPYIQTIKFSQATRLDYSLGNGVGKPTALKTIMFNSANTNSIACDKNLFEIIYY